VRSRGQSHELRVAARRGGDLPAALAAAHREAYGYDLPGEATEVVTLRAVAEAPAPLAEPPADWDLGPARPERRRVIGLAAGREEVRVLDRSALSPGDRVEGPALVEQPDTTSLLDHGDVAQVDAAGNLVVRW
jgi:N-methylhydantoinase A